MNTHIKHLVKSGASWKYNDDGTKTKGSIRFSNGSWNKIFTDMKPTGNQFIIRTGKKFGIIVVDVDIKKGEDGSKTLEDAGICMSSYPTLTFRTASGGYHYFYKWVEGMVDADYLKYVDMIDHTPKNGNDYGWFVFHDTEKYICENDVPIAEMPQELINKLRVAHDNYVKSKSDAVAKPGKQENVDVDDFDEDAEFVNQIPKLESSDRETYLKQYECKYKAIHGRYTGYIGKKAILGVRGQELLEKLNNSITDIGITIEEAQEFLKRGTSKNIVKFDSNGDNKYYDLLSLLDNDWFKSYDKWSQPAYALYNLTDTDKTTAFGIFTKLLKEKAGDLYDLEGAKKLWNESIPEAQERYRKEGKDLVTMAKFKKIVGGSKNALYGEWKAKYEPEATKSKRKSARELRDEEDQLYNELVEELSEAIIAHGRCMIHDENEYSFSDVTKLHRHTIKLADLALLFNRTFVCMLQRGNLFLIIKEIVVSRCKFTKQYKSNTSFDKFDFTNFNSKATMVVVLDDGRVIEVRLKCLIFDISCLIPNYDNMGFYPVGPHDKSEPPTNIFNIFSGFLHKYKEDYIPDPNVVNTFCSMYKEILCNNNEKSYNFEINKLAHIIQHPEIKSESVSIFQGEQGVGKSFLLTFLMMYVFGKHLSLTIFQSEQLTNKFNSHLMGKLFIILEEAVDLGNLKDISKFKGYVRAPMLNVEFKNMDVQESVDCCMNFMIATNNDYNSMFRETGERTANLNKVNDKYYRNTTYFKQMSDIMNNYSAGCDIFHYLANKDLTGFNIRDVPETSEKFNKKLESTNTFFKFLYHLHCDDIDSRHEYDFDNQYIDLNRELGDGDNGYMKIMTIYNSYVQMCEHEFGLAKGSKGVFSKDTVRTLCEDFLDTIEPKKGRKEYLMTKDSVSKALNTKFKTDKF